MMVVLWMSRTFWNVCRFVSMMFLVIGLLIVVEWLAMVVWKWRLLMVDGVEHWYEVDDVEYWPCLLTTPCTNFPRRSTYYTGLNIQLVVIVCMSHVTGNQWIMLLNIVIKQGNCRHSSHLGNAICSITAQRFPVIQQWLAPMEHLSIVYMHVQDKPANFGGKLLAFLSEGENYRSTIAYCLSNSKQAVLRNKTANV